MHPQTRQLSRLPASAALEEILGHFHRDGGVIIEGMFPRAVVSRMHDAAIERAGSISPGAATQGMGEAGAAFVGANTVRFSSLGQISSAFFEMLENDLYRTIADAVLLPHCGSYWLNTGQVMFIGPGECAQALHRDADNWWEFVSATWPETPEVTISAMIGLDHVTEELGATRVVPGSHKWRELDEEPDAASVPAELGPGDALIYSGNVLHGGGANATERWRQAMHLSFVAGWLTPEEASPLDYEFSDLTQHSERVQRLLGHRSYLPGEHRGGGLWLKDVKAIEETN